MGGKRVFAENDSGQMSEPKMNPLFFPEVNHKFWFHRFHQKILKIVLGYFSRF